MLQISPVRHIVGQRLWPEGGFDALLLHIWFDVTDGGGYTWAWGTHAVTARQTRRNSADRLRDEFFYGEALATSAKDKEIDVCMYVCMYVCCGTEVALGVHSGHACLELHFGCAWGTLDVGRRTLERHFEDRSGSTICLVIHVDDWVMTTSTSFPHL